MRVALVSEHADPRRGGAETAVCEMLACLAALGVEVTLVAAPGTAPAAADVRVLPIDSTAATRAGRSRAFRAAVERRLRAESFDVVHALSPCAGIDVYQPRGGTTRATIDGTLARHGPVTRAVRRLLRRFNARQRWLLHAEEQMLVGPQPPIVACVSQLVRRQLLSLGASPERLHVIFNGVSTEPMAELPARDAVRRSLKLDAGPMLLFVAHNFALKGLGELIRALALPDAPRDAHLLVAGRDRPGPYQRLARRLGLPARVHFLGASRPPAVLFAASDALIHPTWYDPCSRVVLEALSAGRPVVTTTLNGAAEAMTPDRHGVVIARPSDLNALACACGAVLAPTFAQACAADAPALRAQLSMQRHARELVTLYEEIISIRRSSAP
ncbi:MAG: Lipopolysaccharide core biosynthesis protein RfaG [Phycisphaerae bacterium]|nr:Lipopolysaccharide core biosynthesis protein RfaG [Phycisphaerae bacterium]